MGVDFTETNKRMHCEQQEDFLEMINNEFDKFIVGEEDTRKTILLITLGGTLVTNAEPTSSNLMVNDESGAGKDYITKSVLKIIPKDNVVIRKRISEKVFTYWHNAKFDKDWTWDGKIFYNEDMSNSVLNSDVFKVMSSSDGENKSTIIVNQTPIEIITRGKPSMVLTIANAYPKKELLRRFPMINLDTSEEQTKLILERKAYYHEKGIVPKYDEEITKGIARLERVKVKVPFASKLIKVLSTKKTIIRTHYDRFADYIKFSSGIHQKSRVMDPEGYLLATKKDYEYGRIALIKTTSNIFSIPLTKNQKRILEIFRQLERRNYSVTDIEPYITFISDRQLRRELDTLAEDGFLIKDKESRENSRKDVMVYSYVDSFKINIPKWEEIENMTSVSHKTSMSDMTSMSINTLNDKNDINDKQIQDTEPNFLGEELVK